MTPGKLVDPDTVDSSRTQEGVPELIEKLHRANLEIVQQSDSAPLAVENDPHLRLRRTLTPSANQGLSRYNEAQFMIQGSTGKRVPLFFSVTGLDGTDGSLDFTMDAYVWGASEETAERRLVALHGISAGVSRTRWHSLGERLAKSRPTARFVALDWHSIDRTPEQPQSVFLTLLPKNLFSQPTPEGMKDLLEDLPPGNEERMEKLVESLKECKRTTLDGSKILKAIIQQGLGWGCVAGEGPAKPFTLCTKSWSGAVGMELLQHARETDPSFVAAMDGMVAMHPACFGMTRETCRSILAGGPDTLMCWASDDNKAPYCMAKWFAEGNPNVRLVVYEEGGHHNFDGSGGLPNFNEEVEQWLRGTQP